MDGLTNHFKRFQTAIRMEMLKPVRDAKAIEKIILDFIKHPKTSKEEIDFVEKMYNKAQGNFKPNPSKLIV